MSAEHSGSRRSL